MPEFLDFKHKSWTLDSGLWMLDVALRDRTMEAEFWTLDIFVAWEIKFLIVLLVQIPKVHAYSLKSIGSKMDTFRKFILPLSFTL